MSRSRWVWGALISVLVCSCDASLPEPESPTAQLYRQRCASCHRLYAPQVLTAEMWGYMLERMDQEMLRRGVPRLTVQEKQELLQYLQKHSSKTS